MVFWLRREDVYCPAQALKIKSGAGMKPRRALLLSGGGAKGAFQAGALRYIGEVEATTGPSVTPYFDVVSGVSVGTLNGVLVAQNRMDVLNDLWRTLSRTDIFRGGGVSGVFRQFLTRKGSLLDNGPLKEVICKNADLATVQASGTDLMFGAVSLATGEYYSFHASDFDDEQEFHRALLASASIPVVCPPVEMVRTRTGEEFTNLVDGGVRNARPLGRVLDLDPDEVVIINCNSTRFITEPCRPSRTIRIALRLLTEVTLHELFRRDVREFEDINALVTSAPPGISLKRKDGRVYRYVSGIVIEPSGIAEDSMDFSRTAIDRQLEAGYLAARHAFDVFRKTSSLGNE